MSTVIGAVVTGAFGIGTGVGVGTDVGVAVWGKVEGSFGIGTVATGFLVMGRVDVGELGSGSLVKCARQG